MPGFDFGEAAIDAYKAIPLHIRQIFAEYTPIIEPLSPDEVYLDVTESKGHQLGDTNLRRYRLFGPVSGKNEQRLVARAPFLRGRGAVCLLAWTTLFPHAFGLRKPAPLWTAPAFDRCLLLGVFYPYTAILACRRAPGLP